ncbi:MAG: hypothetical protein WBE39_06145 [Candidatus Competibacter sp.]
MMSPLQHCVLALGLIAPGFTFGAAVEIDCDTLAQPLKTLIDAVPEDSAIKLSGACHEPIPIAKDRIELSGSGKTGASFSFPEYTANGLSITGRQIVIKKLSLSGAKKSIAVYRDGRVSSTETTD